MLVCQPTLSGRITNEVVSLICTSGTYIHIVHTECLDTFKCVDIICIYIQECVLKAEGFLKPIIPHETPGKYLIKMRPKELTLNVREELQSLVRRP